MLQVYDKEGRKLPFALEETDYVIDDGKPVKLTPRSVNVDQRVMQKTADINKEEILINAIGQLEDKIYMMLLKNNLKFEYTDNEFDKINFEEYTLDEIYDPDRNVNIILLEKR